MQAYALMLTHNIMSDLRILNCIATVYERLFKFENTAGACFPNRIGHRLVELLHHFITVMKLLDSMWKSDELWDGVYFDGGLCVSSEPIDLEKRNRDIVGRQKEAMKRFMGSFQQQLKSIIATGPYLLFSLGDPAKCHSTAMQVMLALFHRLLNIPLPNKSDLTVQSLVDSDDKPIPSTSLNNVVNVEQIWTELQSINPSCPPVHNTLLAKAFEQARSYQCKYEYFILIKPYNDHDITFYNYWFTF